MRRQQDITASSSMVKDIEERKLGTARIKSEIELLASLDATCRLLLGALQVVRLRDDLGGGAWCPLAAQDPDLVK